MIRILFFEFSRIQVTFAFKQSLSVELKGAYPTAVEVSFAPRNSLNKIELAAEYLNDMDEKSLLEVKNGRISILNQDLCGADGACALICAVNLSSSRKGRLNEWQEQLQSRMDTSLISSTK